MKLFIFEPYNWGHCGGAIGIVANTYDDAVNVIVEKSRQEATKSAKDAPSSLRTLEEDIEMRMRYKAKYFARTTDDLDSSYPGHWDQWLLTHTLEVPEEEEARIVFNNWNYS